MLNSDVIKSIKKLNEKREEELDPLYISELIEEKSKEIGISYVELYNLLMNKEYLMEEISKEVNITDIKLETLKSEIETLKNYKREVLSTICELYGHQFTEYTETDIQTCEFCGKQELIHHHKSLFQNIWHKHK